MEKTIKYILLAFEIFVILLIGVVVGWIIYQAEFKKYEINTYFSDDKIYCLKIYQIGSPAWPFGKTDCRFVLYENKKEVSKIDVPVYNDGVSVSNNNFDVKWQKDNVTVIVKDERTKDERYIMYFNGATEHLNKYGGRNQAMYTEVYE